MIPKDHLKLTREELNDLVWAKPMTQVAKISKYPTELWRRSAPENRYRFRPVVTGPRKAPAKMFLNPRCLSSSQNVQKKKRESDAGAASGNETRTPQYV